MNMLRNRINAGVERVRNLLGTGILSIREKGFRVTARRTIRFLFSGGNISYRRWMQTPQFTRSQLEQQSKHKFEWNPLISVITPLYNTSERYLRELIQSLKQQTYCNWELCLADGSDENRDQIRKICQEYAENDKRIRYVQLERNLGIAGNSNAAIAMSKGEYLALLDHDDVLHPAALYEIAEAVCHRGADFIYTDEAIFNDPDITDIRFVHLKPDFAPDNLLGNNYVCHLTTFRRTLLDQCGGFRDGYEGSQDHDLFLRLTARAECIVHIPKVLYYWRANPNSTAKASKNKPYATESGIKAVSDSLRDCEFRATVSQAKGLPTIYRVSYALRSDCPKVSIIIPNRNHRSDLQSCMESVLTKTTYPNYEIVIVENGSTEQEVFRYYREIKTKHRNVRLIRWKGGFNWSAINNYAVNTAEGSILLFLNNDTEVINGNWIEEMLMHAQRPEVGAVGAMLYYPNNRIQHAGVILGLGGVASHAFVGFDRESYGYVGKLCYVQDVSAVTGACMMMRRDVWSRVGGFDEQFAENYNDVDICMRIRREGLLVVWTPYAELYHYESKSRGRVNNAEKSDKMNTEAKRFYELWGKELENGDPYYNPNFSLRHSYWLKDKRHER